MKDFKGNEINIGDHIAITDDNSFSNEYIVLGSCRNNDEDYIIINAKNGDHKIILKKESEIVKIKNI